MPYTPNTVTGVADADVDIWHYFSICWPQGIGCAFDACLGTEYSVVSSFTCSCYSCLFRPLASRWNVCAFYSAVEGAASWTLFKRHWPNRSLFSQECICIFTAYVHDQFLECIYAFDLLTFSRILEKWWYLIATGADFARSNPSAVDLKPTNWQYISGSPATKTHQVLA